MRTYLTARRVDSIKGPGRDKNGCELKRQTFWDETLPGFGIRVTRSGHKTWVAAWRRGGRKGRLRWLKIGSYPLMSLADARDKAKDALADVQMGGDPVAERREAREADTFAEFAQRYLREHARRNKRPRSVREDEKNLNRDLIPAWGTRKLAEITRADVIALLAGIVDRGAPIQANRVRALVSKIFNFAIENAVLEVNVAYKVKKPVARELARERVLAPDELRKVWRAFDQESERVGAMLKLLALNAQREGEVAGMRWAELDLDSEWWTIPGERTKNKITHRVPLLGEALRIVRALKDSASAAAPVTLKHKKRESEYVFVGRTGKSPFSGFSKLLDRVRERSGVDFWVHDLRRTAASGLGELGVERTVIKKILNHADGGVTAIYDRYSYDKEKRAGLLKWDRYLQQVLAGAPSQPAKVVALHA